MILIGYVLGNSAISTARCCLAAAQHGILERRWERWEGAKDTYLPW